MSRSTSTRLRRLAAALVVGGAVVGAGVLGIAAPASAHNYMIASTPAVDGTLTSLPKAFEITTNDKLLDIGNSNSGFAFRIVGPDGRYYENGCLQVDGPSMTTRARLGASGGYTIEWQIVSADGHTVSDSYGFTWQAPASFTPASGSRTAPVCSTRSGGPVSVAGTGSGSQAAGQGSAGVLGDAIWIGAGGLVVVALVVVVLLLLRRPATAPDED